MDNKFNSTHSINDHWESKLGLTQSSKWSHTNDDQLFSATKYSGTYNAFSVIHVIIEIMRLMNKILDRRISFFHVKITTASSIFSLNFVSIAVDQILAHLYTEMLLDMKVSFREASCSIASGNFFEICFQFT